MVFATSTPLTIGFPALILKWFRRIPFVFEVRDLWPEAPIQMGVIKNKFVIYCLKIFEKTIYNNANSIIALSPGMEKGVLECVNGSKTVAMIPNMAKIDLFYPRERDKNMSKYIDFDKFNVIYFGTIGVSNNLNYVVDTAKLLSNSKDNSINFIILGEGKDKPMLEKLIEENNLKNIKLISSKPALETSEIVNACDISLVIFKNIPILRTNSPNKLFDSLSAAKPIIVNSSGWTKTLVEEERCGFYANPNSPQDLIAKIKTLKEDKQLCQEFSANALNLAREKFDKSILVKEVTKIIEESSV
jgi:glycosyltransferase involved in cell wall biosynthesis